jgi:hypothetical protein
MPKLKRKQKKKLNSLFLIQGQKKCGVAENYGHAQFLTTQQMM